MGPMVPPVTVWATRLGVDASEFRGTLSLTGSHLAFDDDERGRTMEIPLGAIRRVRRAFASPVLEVDWLREDGVLTVAFFFSEPPPLDDATGRRRKRRVKRDAMNVLVTQGATHREVVLRWRDEIREAVARAET